MKILLILLLVLLLAPVLDIGIRLMIAYFVWKLVVKDSENEK